MEQFRDIEAAHAVDASSDAHLGATFEGAAADRRSEPRYEGLAERAILSFRGQDHVVPVLNISSRGTMIESDIAPRLGENVVIRFEACSPIRAFVRWSRDGRIGLNFGCEMILG